MADKVVPKIFFSNTSYEYWGRAAALIHTSCRWQTRRADLGERSHYHFTGLPALLRLFRRQKEQDDLLGQQPQSPLPIRYFWRAMIANMDAWVRNDTAATCSSYPKISDGTLVLCGNTRFPPCRREPAA